MMSVIVFESKDKKSITQVRMSVIGLAKSITRMGTSVIGLRSVSSSWQPLFSCDRVCLLVKAVSRISFDDFDNQTDEALTKLQQLRKDQLRARLNKNPTLMFLKNSKWIALRLQFLPLKFLHEKFYNNLSVNGLGRM